MKSMQFFANTFAASVAGIFGYRAFAGLIETEQAYSASSFFDGGLLVANLISLVLVACALRARYEAVDVSLRQWCQNVALSLATFMLASATVAGFMLSIPAGIIAVIVGFVVFSLVLRELRDSVEDYAKGKEFILALPIALAILSALIMGSVINDHPIPAFALICIMMYFGGLFSTIFFGEVSKDDPSDVMVVESVAEPQGPASDAPGQLVDKRV